LAGLWEFPNIPGVLNMETAIAEVERIGIKPKEIIRQVEKKHIFTHIEWHMSGIYMEVKEQTAGYVWMDGAQINAEAALPTAFRQFWEEADYV
jgi:A/G-specific adenine glycosylase